MTQTQTQQSVKWSRISYGEIVDRNAHEVKVRNESGMEWIIANDVFEAEFQVAGEYSETTKVNQTQLIEAVEQNARVAMRVTFRKKAKLDDLVDCVQGLLNQQIRSMPRSQLEVLLDAATRGERRVLTGRHYGSRDSRGRLYFIDMDLGKTRLVDPRTITEVIVGGVRYVSK